MSRKACTEPQCLYNGALFYARIKVLTQWMYNDTHTQLYCATNRPLSHAARLYLLMKTRCVSTQYVEILMLGINSLQLFGEIGA
jgi:hypothetical protein